LLPVLHRLPELPAEIHQHTNDVSVALADQCLSTSCGAVAWVFRPGSAAPSAKGWLREVGDSVMTFSRHRPVHIAPGAHQELKSN
jgi:hypothetical protein